MPLGIGKSERLQTLSKVIVEGVNGFAITELKGMKDLHGRLSIEGLDKVQNAMDAKEVNLLQKRLSELEMEWSGEFDDSRKGTLEKEVLNMLKPHQDNLKKLEIVSYGGIEFPSWVGDPSFLKLACVTIRGCIKCTSLPSLGRLPLLKELVVTHMDDVKIVGPELLGTGVAFPSLEILRFGCMSGWERWSTNGGVIDSVFPCLRELHIRDCPNLVEVSLESLRSLRELDISSCSDGVLRSLVHATSSVTKLKISEISGLTQLHGEILKYLGAVEEVSIWRCDEMRYLWESEAEACKVLVNLWKLRVERCDNLVRLGEKEEDSCGSSLPSLRDVWIWYCGNLERYSCPNSIERLTIKYCGSITSISLPTGGQKKLKRLEIMFCKNLESFPDHELPNLTLLTEMVIVACPSMDDSFPRGLWPPNLSLLQIGELKKPITEWGRQNFPNSLVNLALIGPSSNSTLSHLLPSSLTSLAIFNFRELESLSMGLQHLTSLQRLFISRCPNLRDLPETLTSLQHLSIDTCPNLRDLPETLTSLQHLSIDDCPNLRDLPETLTSLQHLDISHCPMITDLPETLTSVRDLSISYCPNLRDLPETLLPSLLELNISGCPKLKERCSRRGSYWPLISHIPCIKIDWKLCN